MSKVDAHRAIREARYASNRVSDPSSRAATPAPETPTTPAARTPIAKQARATEAAAPEGGEHCGHKSMNGRACTREAAHPEKSHRYS